MKFAAIDPGTQKVGYCVLEWRGRKLRLVTMGTIRAKRGKIHGRLKEIQAAIDKLFKTHRPKQVVVERAFVGRNPASALRLGEARGIALASAGRAGAELFEYAATEAKRAVSPNGKAAKSAVQRSIQLILGMKKPPETDAADAAALGLCHAVRHLGY